MTGSKCLLDTSVVIHAFRSKNKVVETLDALEEIYISVTVVGELYYGAYNSADPAKHLRQIKSFLSNCKTLSTDIGTADIYGAIKAGLAKKGRPIPENDIWIAAASLQYQLPLYTMEQHFKEVEGLQLL